VNSLWPWLVIVVLALAVYVGLLYIEPPAKTSL
jgi:hypothetical protein